MRLVVSPSSSASLVVEEVVDASAVMVMLCNSVHEVIQTLGFFYELDYINMHQNISLGLLPVSRFAI